jgi:hypothetical protein
MHTEHSPVRGFHTRSAPSPSPPTLMTDLPSGVKQPARTSPVWPLKTCGASGGAAGHARAAAAGLSYTPARDPERLVRAASRCGGAAPA